MCSLASSICFRRITSTSLKILLVSRPFVKLISFKINQWFRSLPNTLNSSLAYISSIFSNCEFKLDWTSSGCGIGVVFVYSKEKEKKEMYNVCPFIYTIEIPRYHKLQCGVSLLSMNNLHLLRRL